MRAQGAREHMLDDVGTDARDLVRNLAEWMDVSKGKKPIEEAKAGGFSFSLFVQGVAR